MKQRRIELFSVFLLFILSLSMCFVGTYAWFTAARLNDASGLQVQMYTHELDMSYRVYKYVDDAKEAVDVSGQPDALTLQEYDSVITSRNSDTALILDFNITGMSLNEDIPVLITTTCEDPRADSRMLSNIIKLQFANISTITSDNANDIYRQANAYFDSNHIEELTFKNGGSKVRSLEYLLDSYDYTDGAVRLFIRIDYSPTLIEEFSFSVSDASTTSFGNDLTMISCDVEEN